MHFLMESIQLIRMNIRTIAATMLSENNDEENPESVLNEPERSTCSIARM